MPSRCSTEIIHCEIRFASPLIKGGTRRYAPNGLSGFNGPTVTEEAPRDSDGEQRFNSTGFLGTAIVTITHTETESKIHIISMRKAEHHEIDTLSHYL